METDEKDVENFGQRLIEEKLLEYEFDKIAHEEFLDKRRISYGVSEFFNSIKETKEKPAK